MVYSVNFRKPFGYIDKLMIRDFSSPTVLWGIDGDWMNSYIPEENESYLTDHRGEVHCKTSEMHARYLAHILKSKGMVF